MPDEPREPFPLLRRILPYLSVGILIAGLYVAYVFYSRWSSSREAARAQNDKVAADAKRTVDLLGGGQFKILQFYAIPGAIKRGGRSTMCYGVSEAKGVKIDPPIEELHPALNHCLQVSPKVTTTYTLTADDGKGHTAVQTVQLEVIP